MARHRECAAFIRYFFEEYKITMLLYENLE